MHTYEDQGIDYDNSLVGIESVFHIQNRLDLSITVGSNNSKSRINPADVEPSLSIKELFGGLHDLVVELISPIPQRFFY